MDAIRRMNQLFGFMAVWAALTAMVSCSNDTDEITILPDAQEEKVEHKAVMHLTGGLRSYTSKKETTTEWKDDDVILLRFYQADGETVVCGKAIYDASSSAWDISYYGNLATGSTLKCEAFHFVNATLYDNYSVLMEPNSCAYVDYNASYIVDGGELYVNAILAPKTARMRIQGKANGKVNVSNITYNTYYSLTYNTFLTESKTIKTTIGSDGYTPYIYGSLGEDNKITLDDMYYRYTKTLNAADFTAGQSGYIVMPSQEENKGWTSEYYYPENSVDMGLSVRWASLNVGASDQYGAGYNCSWGDAYGVNTSVSTNYNYGVTQIAGDPAYDIATFLWGERWQIPTKEQWQELIDNCTWTYAYNSDKQVYGYTVTANNGNSIYLPFYFYTIETGTVSSSSSSGYYWTSTPRFTTSNDYYAYMLKLTSSSKSLSSYEYKYTQMQIRPIVAK